MLRNPPPPQPALQDHPEHSPRTRCTNGLNAMRTSLWKATRTTYRCKTQSLNASFATSPHLYHQTRQAMTAPRLTVSRTRNYPLVPTFLSVPTAKETQSRTARPARLSRLGWKTASTCQPRLRLRDNATAWWTGTAQFLPTTIKP